MPRERSCEGKLLADKIDAKNRFLEADYLPSVHCFSGRQCALCLVAEQNCYFGQAKRSLAVLCCFPTFAGSAIFQVQSYFIYDFASPLKWQLPNCGLRTTVGPCPVHEFVIEDKRCHIYYIIYSHWFLTVVSITPFICNVLHFAILQSECNKVQYIRIEKSNKWQFMILRGLQNPCYKICSWHTSIFSLKNTLILECKQLEDQILWGKARNNNNNLHK